MMAVTWVDRERSRDTGSPEQRSPEERRSVGDALVRRTAARAGLGEVSVVRRSRGQRPGLTVPGVCHSVAHAGPLTACVLADANVGIDLELRGHPRERRLRPAGLHRFLTPRERADLTRDPSRLPDVFTRKEAWAKYTGRGLELGLGSIDVADVQRTHPELRLATFDLRGAVCSLWFPAGEQLAPVELTPADLGGTR